jgi:hypothetical protein
MSSPIASRLGLQVEGYILDCLLQATDLINFADDAYQTIIGIILGRGHTLARTAWTKAIDMRRANFATIPQYITEFRQGVKVYNKLDI